MPRMLENWLHSYAEYTEVSEAPYSFDFWTGLSIVSAALQRKVFIDEVKFKIFPNMYVIFVGPPGVVTKSTTISMGTKFLRDLEGISMGPTVMTWQGLIKGMVEAQQSYSVSPNNIINPLDMEFMSQAAILCKCSELGTFLDMHNGELVNVLINLWDGEDDPFEKWLATKENVKIVNPLIGLIGGTTPTWMEQHFDASALGNGLTARIIFVYGDQKRRYIPYISDLVEPEGQKQLGETLLHDLREISRLKGKFTITREARNFVGEWYYNFWNESGKNREEHLKDPRFAGYCGRKFSHVHKVAMCISASKGDSLTIGYEDISLAFGVLAGIEADMLKVLNNIGKVQSSRQMDTILTILETKGGSLKRDVLWKAVMTSISPREFSEAIDGLISAGLIKMVTIAGAGSYIRLLGESDDNVDKSTAAE